MDIITPQGPSEISVPKQKSSTSTSWVKPVGSVIVLLLIAGGLLWYQHKHGVVKNENPPKTDGRGNTFADAPFPKFPVEFVLEGSTPPEYFDNAQATGAWFIVKKTFAEVRDSYKQQLANTDWDDKTTVFAENLITVTNKRTKAFVKISMESLPDKATIVTVGITK